MNNRPDCMRARRSRGFALLSVLWTVAILAAVAAAITGAIRIEALTAANERDVLVAERLARSGQEAAAYLETRGWNLGAEILGDLAVIERIPEFHYEIRFPEGVVDIYLESDAGKINPASASPALLFNFFTLWKNDPAAGFRIASAIEQWRSERNNRFGMAAMMFMPGLDMEDFQARIINGAAGNATDDAAMELRPGLGAFLGAAPGSGRIHPGFASELVLRAIPGMSPEDIARIVEARRSGPFRNREDFQQRAGIPEDSPAWQYLTFNRAAAPAILAVGRPEGSRIRRVERRVFHQTVQMNPATGNPDTLLSLVSIERNALPDWLSP